MAHWLVLESVQSLIIPVDATASVTPPLKLELLKQTEGEGLAPVLHERIGGWFQVVRAPHGAYVYLDEEGKLKGLPVNMLATLIAQEVGLGDWIVGPAVVVGPPDGEGFDTSVPEEFLNYVESLGCSIAR